RSLLAGPAGVSAEEDAPACGSAPCGSALSACALRSASASWLACLPCGILPVPARDTAHVSACPSSDLSVLLATHAPVLSVTFPFDPTVSATVTFYVTQFACLPTTSAT